MAFKIPKGFLAPVRIGNFRDADGNPTDVESILSVTVSDPTKSEVVDIDGEKYVGPRVDGNPVGDGQQVIVTCDVRFGPEVREVAFVAAFDVPAGEAATADVTFGELTPRG